MTTDDTSLSPGKATTLASTNPESEVGASKSGSASKTEGRSSSGGAASGGASHSNAAQGSSAHGSGASQGKLNLDGIVAGFVESGRAMSPKLKELLAGTIALRVVDRSRAFLFGDFDGAFGVKETTGFEARSLQGDCMIDLTEAALTRIWRGDINPQIAMLSDKVSISGKSAMAVYFFNLAGR